MPLRYRFDTVTSASADVVPLPQSGVTCIVGGNNAGKSQLLRELKAIATRSAPDLDLVVLSDATAAVSGPADAGESQAWLRMAAFPGSNQERNAPERFAAVPGEWGLTSVDFARFFQRHPPGSSAHIGQAADFIIRLAAAGRLADYATGEMQGAMGPARTNWTLEKIYARGSVGKAIENLTVEAFGVPVILDRANVPTMFRVGNPGVEVPPLDNPSDEYREAVSSLPTLDTQGDGLKSFVGLTALLLAMRPEVVLLDEPEAFLHPGQARAVGRWIARAAVQLDLQVVLATHDRDLLLGLMSGERERVSVVRVARDQTDGRARFHHLPDEELERVWSDPVLRYSNVLQGLFHRRVVICESDGDCRFFAAALDAAATAGVERAAAEDTLFVPSGGKQRAATLAQSLSRLGVPTAAILDFDSINRKAVIKGVLEAVGGVWDDHVNGLYTKVADKVNQTAGLWEVLKNAGVNAFPAGDAHAALIELLDLLEGRRIHILRMGEMEDLNKNLSQHGGDWVTEALAAGTHRDANAARIVRPLLS